MNRRKKYKTVEWRKKVEFEGKTMMQLERDIILQKRFPLFTEAECKEIIDTVKESAGEQHS